MTADSQLSAGVDAVAYEVVNPIELGPVSRRKQCSDAPPGSHPRVHELLDALAVADRDAAVEQIMHSSGVRERCSASRNPTTKKARPSG